MTAVQYCPIHEYEHRRCSDKCWLYRLEQHRISNALRAYWRCPSPGSSWWRYIQQEHAA